MFELIISYMDDSTLFLQSVECRNVRVLELVTTGEERSRVWLVPKRRYPALNRVSVRRKLKGEISKRRMTQNVVENCWKTAVRWLASGRNERESLPFYYVIILPSMGVNQWHGHYPIWGRKVDTPGDSTLLCSATPMRSIASPYVTLQWQTSGSTSPASRGMFRVPLFLRFPPIEEK